MTWFPERIERVCRQPPERCRDLAWLHRGLSTVSGAASRRSWAAEARPPVCRRAAVGRIVAGERPRRGRASYSVCSWPASDWALRHRDQRWRSLRCPPTRGRQALPPSWRCQPPRRSWPSYAGTPRRSPLTENDVRVPAHGVPMRAVGTRRLQSRRRVCSPRDEEDYITRHVRSGPCFSGLGVGRLVVVGAQTDWCARSTLHGALARGYDATLVGDAHTTEDQTDWEAPPPDKVIVLPPVPGCRYHEAALTASAPDDVVNLGDLLGQ